MRGCDVDHKVVVAYLLVYDHNLVDLRTCRCHGVAFFLEHIVAVGLSRYEVTVVEFEDVVKLNVFGAAHGNGQ